MYVCVYLLILCMNCKAIKQMSITIQLDVGPSLQQGFKEKIVPLNHFVLVNLSSATTEDSKLRPLVSGINQTTIKRKCLYLIDIVRRGSSSIRTIKTLASAVKYKRRILMMKRDIIGTYLNNTV